MSVRTSSFNSIPSEDIWSAWVRRCVVHFWIHASVLVSFPSSCMGEEFCHVHLSPQGQLILTSVNGLLVLSKGTLGTATGNEGMQYCDQD